MSKSRPVIGISAGFDDGGSIFLRRQYSAAIKNAGGVPILLPTDAEPETALSICDGLLLSGGGDVEPKRYSLVCDPSIIVEPSPERDENELALAKLAFERGLPCLAICRGIQVMNVALGGTLLHDIPGHRQSLPRHEHLHTVKIAADSLLYSLVGAETLAVNSFHHQSIDSPAPSLTVTAVSPDNVIEAVEAESARFFLGVQWHPEHLPEAAPLFEGFLKVCKE